MTTKSKKSCSNVQQTLDYKNFTIDRVNIAFGKLTILENTKLSIKYGEHYALVGKNGIGKTSLLNAIANRTVAIPERLDLIYVKQEEAESDNTVINILLSSDETIYNMNKRLAELEELVIDPNVSDDVVDEFDAISKKIGNEYQLGKARAQKILHGLGFNNSEQEKQIKCFSGGWRMRISLAKALFMVPTLLILDEPTNHLDLHGNIWLTEYLKTYPKTLLLVSHDKYFINEVCTTIVHIENKKLCYYTGNYGKFQKQLELNRQKDHKNWDLLQKKIVSMRKSQKSPSEIDEYVKSKSITKPEKEYKVNINFLQPNEIKGTFINMENITFGYEPDKLVFQNFSMSIGPTSRIAIVGKNGIGKSTLLKLIAAEINPIEGELYKSDRIRIGYYNQHFEKCMPMNITPIQYLEELNNEIDIQTAHKYLSMFGLEPIYHKTSIGILSGGQKARVKFASFGVTKPHILMLDEPTNHLDIVSIESLIDALNNFSGAIILVTHNFDLITKLDADLYIIDKQILERYDGSYDDYITDVCADIVS